MPPSTFYLLLKFAVVLQFPPSFTIYCYKPNTIVSLAQLGAPKASFLKKMYFPSTASISLPTEKSLCLATLKT